MKYKKHWYAFLVLSQTATLTFAGTVGPTCTPGSVTIPCNQQAWEFGGQALYLQPSYNDGAGYYIGSTNTSNDLQFISGTSDWNWGFMLEVSKYFSESHQFILNWYHFDENNTTLYDNTISIGGPFINLRLGENKSYLSKPQWDSVNAEVGQLINYGQSIQISFLGGVNYSSIQGYEAFRSASPTVTNRNLQQTVNATYHGFGPRTGISAKYDIGSRINIYADGAISLLVGTSKVNYTADRSTPTSTSNVIPAEGRQLSGNTTLIVPELEGNLGINYTYNIQNSKLIADAGYMWVNYFRPTPSNSQQVGRDFALQGIYFGLKWQGSLA